MQATIRSHAHIAPGAKARLTGVWATLAALGAALLAMMGVHEH
jgi:hypothetical protein